MMERIFDHLKEQGIKVFDFQGFRQVTMRQILYTSLKIVQEDTQYNIMESGFGVKKNLFPSILCLQFLHTKSSSILTERK